MLTNSLFFVGSPKSFRTGQRSARISEPYLGSIALFPYNYTPAGWLECNGQSVSVNTNQALYALIGNKFGGNSSTFNLPNMVGVAPSVSANAPTNTIYNTQYPQYCIATLGVYPSFDNGAVLPTAIPNTPTSSRTPTTTQTRTPSPTHTETPTNTATFTYTPTNTQTATGTPTYTNSPTQTATTTGTATASHTQTPSDTATSTRMMNATHTQTLTPTLNPTQTPTATTAAVATGTKSPVPLATITRTVSIKSSTPTRSATKTITKSPTRSKTKTRTRTPTRTR